MTTQNLSGVRIIIESAFYFAYSTVNVAFVEKKKTLWFCACRWCFVCLCLKNKVA